MKIFLDTAEVNVIAELAQTGLVDGVTTNPTLIAKSGRPMAEVIAEICRLVEGPISAEVAATDYESMLAEGRHLAGVAPNVVVKVPLTWDGLRATRALADLNIKTNVTLCFSVAQALMAAKAGATFVSPFMGRVDDHGGVGAELIQDIREVYDRYDFATEVLAASLRHGAHVREAALAGADAATLPPDVFRALVKHPLTDKGLDQFLADWAKTGQSIL
ncbi:fructose-6-phosphate aldolase [Brevundimonas sp. 2R-24]|uniref:Probable transaldolase n=1 Tax=Peiella sedimenti TaxID=3061083 RepID=A0ABT8SM87_9CAUL|nr:fructose-6-phosphate aldolase [Caulobacteraceae bacterium XZ-24]